MNRIFWFALIVLTVIHPFTDAQVYNRVVSLAPSITKNIYSMGAQKQLAGCTSYCKTNKTDNIKIVANAVQVNMEILAGLKPDLVLIMGLTPPESIEMIKKLGIKFVKFETPRNFEEICQQYIETGKLLGFEKEAILKTNTEKAKLEKLKQKIPKGKKPAIFIELGIKPLFAVIPNTFMHDYILTLGGTNIATDVNSGIISKETVLMRNPDAIFITAMGNSEADELKSWKSYRQLNASKNNMIFTLDSDMACTPCPDSYTATVYRMFELLYGKQD
ncbi:MAG: ABC transporter substrate-binding protein [Bacteroidales bacterium]